MTSNLVIALFVGQIPDNRIIWQDRVSLILGDLRPHRTFRGGRGLPGEPNSGHTDNIDVN
jgi:hypothetical protein